MKNQVPATATAWGELTLDGTVIVSVTSMILAGVATPRIALLLVALALLALRTWLHRT